MTDTATAGYSESAVVAIIVQRIKDGTYAPGGRLPSERALAEEFSISRRFARMALAQLVEQGFLEKSHYRRPFVAFSGTETLLERAPGKPSRDQVTPIRTIAAVVPSSPVFPGGLEIVSGIHKVLADTESQCRLTFLDTFHKDRPEVLRREAQAIRSVLDGGAVGLLWWFYADEDAVRDIVAEHPDISIIFIDRYPRGIACDFVGIDDLESSRTAVEYLMDLGHTRIAHLMDPGSYSTILERAEGYRTAHALRGMDVSEELVVHLNWDEDRMEQAFRQLFSLSQPPTALFTSNDFIAHEFIKIAESHGIRVPQDLSVIGHGNIDRYTPRGFLTSMEQPFEMIGRAAAKLLLKRLSSERTASSSGHQQIILQAPIVVRESCRRL